MGQSQISKVHKPAPPVDFFSVYGKNPVKNRTDKNSTSAALSGFAGAIDDVPLPDGISLRSEEEHVIWNQFTRARAREDWRDMNLIIILILIFSKAFA